MGVAAQLSTWAKRWPKLVAGPPHGGTLPGTPILQQQFPGLFFVVEIAWNGKQGTNSAAWSWTDVTADVQASNQVHITIGGADEAATTQPAQCTYRLDNRSGRYSKGPQSGNYPNVTVGVPIRVRAFLNGFSYTRFQGYSVGFTPSWDVTGNYAVVDVVAAGSLRRFAQGTDPLQSTLRRSIPGLSSLVAYWPCEDGTQATSFVSALGGSPIAVRSGTAKPASFTGFVCSSPIPTLGTDSWFVGVPGYVATGNDQVRFLIGFPAAGTIADGSRIISINTGGSVSRVDVLYYAGGSLGQKVYDGQGNVLLNTGPIFYNIDSVNLRMSVQWTPSGSDTVFGLDTVAAVHGAGASYVNNTVTGQSVTGISSIAIAPDGTMSGAAIGHIYIQSINDDIFSLGTQLTAYVGEEPGPRLVRLTAEQGETSDIYGFDGPTMGAQLPNTFINLLRECEAADLGILYDGIGPGVRFTYRTWKENRAADLVLDASSGDIADPVQPYDDDQLVVNQFTATRSGGGSYTFTDTTDVLAAATVGDYSSSATVNVQTDSQAQDYAGWRVHMGTSNADGYRYPTLNFKFEEAANVLPGWLPRFLSDRIDIVNLSTVRTQHADTTVSLLLEGYTESIDKFTWHVTANCSPYAPWRVGCWAADSGDTNPYVMRLETDGASLVTAAAVGATSLSVSTPSGPLWTTVADDFPFDVNIGGWQVTVTNITGGSSPQTFTVNATPTALPAGAAVSLWQPCVLAL
jgi:hypothetical protein